VVTVVDPPRAGLDDDTLKLAQRFDNILYISCNPQTLADNLAILIERHTIVKTAFFDQFPYTQHLESGVLLQRKEDT
jgi:tRNA (uracil-5-)-methyltransferase